MIQKRSLILLCISLALSAVCADKNEKFIVNARFKPDAMVYVNRGTDLLQKGDFRGARVNFEAAIASIPPSGLPIWIAHRFSPTTGNGSWPCKIAMPRCVFAPGFFGLRFCARR